jgi:hypothetical protein
LISAHAKRIFNIANKSVNQRNPGNPADWHNLDLSLRISRDTHELRAGERIAMAGSRDTEKQNVTLSLSRRVLKKARILAARRETSISGLLSQEVESLVAEEELYERSERQALELLEQRFRLGGKKIVSREKLHER